ncbi:MAG: 4-hydroxy-3-methylbut-2-enyl diphosphate reductase [Treponema sp.]
MNNIRCIKRAQVLGYCMGVQKAVDAVLQALAVHQDKNIYTYGPLIHNPVTMQVLAEKGVRILDTERALREQLAPHSVVVIRAHGIAPEKRQELQESGAMVIDATCPHVVASQRQAARYAKNGYTVILAGDKNHGEIIGITGYVHAVPESRCIIVHSAVEASALTPIVGQAVLLAQTTMKRLEYHAIAQIIEKKQPHLCVLETICAATDERQHALQDLAQQVDALLIIGGKNSANTQRLLQTARSTGKPAWIAETIADIPSALFQYHTVGLSAGASTPALSIDSIEEYLTLQQ